MKWPWPWRRGRAPKKEASQRMERQLNEALAAREAAKADLNSARARAIRAGWAAHTSKQIRERNGFIDLILETFDLKE